MFRNRARSARSRYAGIPGTVWALGFVSLCMDISSEMIHSLLPLFLVSALGAGAISVGLIEGVAEAAAMITRLFSGAWSDRVGNRKALALTGYAIGALTKPLFALAPGVGLVFTARFLDRLGKGVRGAPRDALVADTVAAHQRGAAYGLRQSLDTVGAFLGPALAMVLMFATAGSYRTVFWVAVVPGVLAVAILACFVREPALSATGSSRRCSRFRDIAGLGRAVWAVVALGSLFNLARFSEAFLLLRAENIGMPAGWVPAILIIMNVCYALTAYPSGHLSDRLGRRGLIVMGLASLIAADLTFAAAKSNWQVVAGASFWGLHLGLTQGLLAALVADASPPHLRGTSFGVFSLTSGLSLLAASLTAGWLWDRFGAPTTFYAGAFLAGCALIAVWIKPMPTGLKA